MNKLRLASFGIRGFIGDSLPPPVVIDFASAFATYLDGGRVLLGRDTRYSSPMLHSAVVSGLVAAGCEVTDFGVCPAPMLQHAVPRFQAAGAVAVSGGHNTMGWNAVSLIGPDGALLEPAGGETVLDIFHARAFRKQDWRRMGRIEPARGFAEPYFAALASYVNVEAVRAAGFTVLIDPVGGAGCPYLAPFAKALGLHLVPINAAPSGYLAREPEPRPRSAIQMASIIRHVEGQAGFVLSSDMGRMSVVTETGEPASEEYTLALMANHVLAKHPGTLVTNICTTRTVDDVARAHGAEVVKTRVGQAYILSALSDSQGQLGGEGSGSVVLPAFSNAFDGFVMMALILEAMAESGETLSTLLSDLPRYHIVKRSVPCGSRDGYRAIEGVRSSDQIAEADHTDLIDGLRADWRDSWVHVRTSQTQQMVRVIAEAVTADVAEARADDMVRIIQQTL